MLRFLEQYLCSRTAWLLMALSAFFLELLAIWLQYTKIQLKPCLLCIYERCALLGIMLSCFFAALAVSNITVRYITIISWLYSAWKGISLTWRHIIIQSNQLAHLSCNFSTNFQRWFPLDKLLSHIFPMLNRCNYYDPRLKFLTSKMPELLLVIFIVYFIMGSLALIIQLLKN